MAAPVTNGAHVLHLSIALGYDIVGIRWDSQRGDNLIIFEKALNG